MTDAATEALTDGELIEYLRQEATGIVSGPLNQRARMLATIASDRQQIADLRAQVETLREALRPFAEAVSNGDFADMGGGCVLECHGWYTGLSLAHLRKAAAVMGEKL